MPSAYLLVLYISAIMCCMALKNYSSSPMSVFSWLVICQNVGLSVNLHFDWFIYKLVGIGSRFVFIRVLCLLMSNEYGDFICNCIGRGPSVSPYFL